MAIAAPILLLIALLLTSSPSSMAEIKHLHFVSDSRPIILIEAFGFTAAGAVSISLSSASSSSPDPSLLGFFLISDDSILQASIASQNPDPSSNPSCVLQSPYIIPLFTLSDFDNNNGVFNRTFKIHHPDEYSLFFANCAAGTSVSMDLHTEMYNRRPDGRLDYLSVGQSAVPTIYAFFAFVYLVFLVVWVGILVKNRVVAHRIHALMGGLLATKMLNLLFAAEDQHYLRKTGTPHGWDVLFYVFQFLKGVLLFTVIVLIGTGWSFLKPFLQEREKKVLMVVIPLQVVANIASVVVGENGPFLRGYVTWTQLFLLIDVVCCCAVLFPIIWSIRDLKETSKTDGKAARNLSKLMLFRQFYIVVIGYLYFTRIVVFALNVIVSYKFKWVSVGMEETASLAFYIVMFYMFRPVARNEYFALDDESEEAAELAIRQDDFEI